MAANIIIIIQNASPSIVFYNVLKDVFTFKNNTSLSWMSVYSDNFQYI